MTGPHRPVRPPRGLDHRSRTARRLRRAALLPTPAGRCRRRASSTCSRRRSGGEEERASGRSCPARSRVMRARPDARATELHFLLEDVGPGTNRLCELRAGRRAADRRPARPRIPAAPRDGRTPAARRWRRRDRAARDLAGPARGSARVAARLPRRRRMRPGRRLAAEHAARHRRWKRRPSRPRHRVARGPTSTTNATPRCTPAGHRRCSRRSERCAQSATSPPSWRSSRGWHAGSAHASAASVPTRDGYIRLCVDGPVLDAVPAADAPSSQERGIDGRRSAGSSSQHPIINASGTFDAIAAVRVFGDELIEQFPFAAFVSKTVTLAPRQGNPPPRLWEIAGRDDQLDRAAEQGPRAATSPQDLPRSSPSCRCR